MESLLRADEPSSGFIEGPLAGVAALLPFNPGTLPTAALTFDPGQAPVIQSPINFAPPSLAFDELGMANFLNDLTGGPSGRDAIFQAIDLYRDPLGQAILSSKTALNGGGVTYESRAGDYAEWLEKMDPEEPIKVGDVVGVFGGQITVRVAVGLRPSEFAQMHGRQAATIARMGRA